jgi:hypothetical protein
MGKRAHTKKAKLESVRRRMNEKLEDGEYVERPDLGSPCIFVQGQRNKPGYVLMDAIILGFKSPACAHVVSYMIANNIWHKNRLPKDKRSVHGRKDIHHICSEGLTGSEELKRARSCCQPLHLTCLTHLQNIRLGSRASKTHCIHGHDLADAYIKKDGCRDCLECHREYSYNRYHNDLQHRAKKLLAAKQKRRAKGMSPWGSPEHKRKVTESLKEVHSPMPVLCGCEGATHHARGLCHNCYERERYHKRKEGT